MMPVGSSMLRSLIAAFSTISANRKPATIETTVSLSSLIFSVNLRHRPSTPSVTAIDSHSHAVESTLPAARSPA